MTTQAPVPYSLFIKAEGAKCNLDCSYCYYLKQAEQRSTRMSEAKLQQVIKNHIQSQPDSSQPVDFIWHGGEPMLRGLEFYQQAVALQQQHAAGRPLANTLQTNGTLINQRWAQFFREHKFFIGVSIDGDQVHHDIARIDHSGQSSFQRTMRGIAHLKAHQVDFNTLTVVNNRTYQQGKAIYQFLKQHGSGYMQFQPCIDHPLDRRSEHDWSLNGKQWGEFLCDVFDQWSEQDVGQVYVQFFENCLMLLMGYPSQMCHHAASCGQQLMAEADGEVYSCDHFAYSDHRLGNVQQDSLQSMVSGQQQRQFAANKSASLCSQCQSCDFLALCQGGCPKNRSLAAEPGKALNQLCEGYQMFFIYALPRLLKMSDAMMKGYSPAHYKMF
ncbi:anaerobic sulfatase maturase [Agarivorans sp. QJM3NY_33]|uniref:anaerobic sulfatase maturase n=1 Tax=Agarivorans sp. QJM3NY_33 TaxID=3421432 RepID=UPI003D7E4CF6